MKEQTTITKEAYKQYILSHQRDEYEIRIINDNRIFFVAEKTTGQVNFYPHDIVELTIVSNEDEDEALFYLHFQLSDEKHAKELFHEMISTLIHQDQEKKVRVLLICSSGITTNYYVSLLNNAVTTLQMNFEFKAADITKVFTTGFDYDVIMLAPQVHHEYEKMKQIFRTQLVIPVPPAVFARYSTGSLIQLIIEERKSASLQKKKTGSAEGGEPLYNHYRILSIAMISYRSQFRFAYRIYDHGKKTLDKEVIKPSQSFQDIIDLLDYVLARHENIDAIGLALPGIAYHGHLYHPDYGFTNDENIGVFLSTKYHKPVTLMNDVNAVALGYYAFNENDKNMVFYFQPREIPYGGAGMIINGKLYRGWKSAAGEMGSLIPAIVESPEEKIRTIEGAEEIVTKTILSLIALFAPNKIVLHSKLTPDIKRLQELIGRYVDAEYIPDLVYVEELKEYMLAGGMIHCQEILDADPETFRNETYNRSETEQFMQVVREMNLGEKE